MNCSQHMDKELPGGCHTEVADENRKCQDDATRYETKERLKIHPPAALAKGAFLS